jgi:ABC-type iron transport system FetAB permease component
VCLSICIAQHEGLELVQEVVVRTGRVVVSVYLQPC